MRSNNLQERRMRRPYGLVIAILAASSIAIAAQGPPGGRGAPQPPRTPRAAAPVDFSGYWVSVVTEDWRWRMVTPARGDFAGVPLNAAARKLGQAWDPAKDEAEGNQCKAYGAAGIMRMPGRLHITWQDDTTLKIDTDQGTQTRVFHFGGNPRRGSSLRGRATRARTGKARSADRRRLTSRPSRSTRARARAAARSRWSRPTCVRDICARTASLTARTPSSASTSICRTSATATRGSS